MVFNVSMEENKSISSALESEGVESYSYKDRIIGSTQKRPVALYLFFIFIGGRFEELVIDQDSALISSEFLGEVVETRVFKEFLREQELKLFVCRKADPESKGSVENLVRLRQGKLLQ